MSETIHECSSDVLIARIRKGEEIVKSILDFCKNNSIDGAWITGLGAISTAKLASYDLKNKKYIKKELIGSFEVCTLVGNVGKKDGEYVAHIHVILSDEEMKAFGGHLDAAIVAATLELKVEVFDQPIIRKHDEEIGLNLIEIN